MKVLLIKDVYKLGRAGEIKRVADGFGRNFLLPQRLAVLVTPGALKQVDQIKSKATVRRAELNNELGGLAELISKVSLTFASKAGETGKLYGSITNQMIADAISSKLGTAIDRRQIEVQPIRVLGEHRAKVRLTIDLVPEVVVMVHREGEVPSEAPVTAAPAEATPLVSASAEVPDADSPVGQESVPSVEIAGEEKAD